MSTASPTPDDLGDIDQPLPPMPIKSTNDVLARARVVALRIEARVRKATEEADPRLPPPPTDPDPPVP